MALEYTKGYNGKIARVNLTTGAITIETPADDLYRTYVGGHGFISYFLFKELPAGCDPSPFDEIVKA